MAKYNVLLRYYNKHGINDGVVYQVVNERFQIVSNHKTRALAEKKAKTLNRRTR